MAFQIPKSVTGGCLCGGVRYKVDFAADHDWEKSGHSCQCTQCRKNSGTLIMNYHTISNKEITWLSKATYAEYNSSATYYRGFCNKCGSPLTWRDEADDTSLEITIGSIDEEFLVGPRDDDDRPKGAYGVALAPPKGEHFWLRNEVPGVTESFSAGGTKFLKGSSDGPMKSG